MLAVASSIDLNYGAVLTTELSWSITWAIPGTQMMRSVSLPVTYLLILLSFFEEKPNLMIPRYAIF